MLIFISRPALAVGVTSSIQLPLQALMLCLSGKIGELVRFDKMKQLDLYEEL